MSISFYLCALTRCSCGKPATQDVQGTGNVSYGKFCNSCANRKLKELRAYWERQDKAAQQRQVEDTQRSQ